MRPTLLPWLCLLVLAVSGEDGHLKTVEDGEDSYDPLVKVAHGKLRGRVMTSWKEARPFVSFQGIPYAKPPVGSLRFKPPAALDPWKGTRDAISDASPCYQDGEGNEDCLYLNVYTPQLPGPSATSLKAVMVWIHGGLFVRGSNSQLVYPGDYYVEQDIVLVVLNYRLGPFGFLNLHTADAPGNIGLKDQVMALLWVQQNIDQFGGDPGRVTIFGEDAGGASVHYHILSPMSQGLFDHAISQSGSSLNEWAFSSDPKLATDNLIEMAGCKDNDTLIQCLQETPANKISNSSMPFSLIDPKNAGVNVPSVESDIPGLETFLLDTPLKLVAWGHSIGVPYIIGVNDGEGLIFLDYYLRRPDDFRAYSKDKAFISLYYDVSPNSTKTEKIAKLVEEFYFLDKEVGLDTFSNYSLYLGDTTFLLGVDDTARAHSAVAPVYYYEFVFDGELGILKSSFGGESVAGVCHADDLGYLFPSWKVRNIRLDPMAVDNKVSAGLVKMWTNFAKTGNPTSELTDYVNVTWTPVMADYMHYMEIGATLRSKTDLAGPRIKFWRELNPFGEGILKRTVLPGGHSGVWGVLYASNVLLTACLTVTFMALFIRIISKQCH